MNKKQPTTTVAVAQPLRIANSECEFSVSTHFEDFKLGSIKFLSVIGI